MEAEMLQSVLWRSHDIQARVAQLGRAISDDFDGRPVVILGVIITLCLFHFLSRRSSEAFKVNGE